MTDEQFKILIKTIKQGLDKIAIATLASGMVKSDTDNGAWQVATDLIESCLDDSKDLLRK